MTEHSAEVKYSKGPIAIVGASCLFPKAQSLEEYWSNIKRGVDAITEVPASHWDSADYFDADPKKADHTYCRRGGFLSPVDFDPTEFGIAPHNLEATDSSQLLGLVVAQGALVDAGYGPTREFNRGRVSVILGVTGTLQLSIALGGRLGHPIWRRALEQAGVEPGIAQEVIQNIGDAHAVWQENSFPGLLGNVVAGRIANRFDLGGTNCVVDAACASSISAAHLASMELLSGRADMVITGGVDTFNDIFMYMCFSKTPALSPTGDARPFDAQADGTILGEGIGMVVLKRLEDAERDGDKIYAVIKGIGSSSDGRGKAIYAPSAEGQVRALEAAYAMADVSPATVNLVEAHGTGTRVGDATEVSALKKVYRAARDSGVWCALGSVKSQIGHTKAAAGIAGLIKIALALRFKVLPPTIKVSNPNPEAITRDSPFYLNTEKRPWLPRLGHPRRAAASAFGFGGSNFHVVLEEHRAEKQEIDWDGRVQLIALSGETMDALQSKVRSWSDPITWSELRKRAAASRREFSSLHPFRLVLAVEQDKTDLASLFNEIQSRLEKDQTSTNWSLPQGAFFGKARNPGKLAFLFPGQGSQYLGMGRDLVCLFPKMQEILAQADLAYGDVADLALQLSDFIFPYTSFNEEAKKLNELALRATHVAQPAIGAISLGMICVLSMFGAHPAMAGGHSFGELVALLASGKIDQQAFFNLAKLRGQLMAEGSGDRGSMLAVQASIEEIQHVIDEEKLDLVIANKNAPRQTVLSGQSKEIRNAAVAFQKRKISCTELPVAAAFHSEFVAGAQKPFAEALNSIPFKPGKIPAYSNTTGGAYPDDVHAAREFLSGQLAKPVDFVHEVESMYADGARTFLEVGPSARLTGLVRSILTGKEHQAISVDASSGRSDSIYDFALALAQLAALGHEVDLSAWDGGNVQSHDESKAKKPRMTVPITGANYRAPQKAILKPAPPQKNGNGAHPSTPNHGAPAAVAESVSLDFPPQPQPLNVTSTQKEAPVRQAPLPPPQHATARGPVRPASPIPPKTSSLPASSFQSRPNLKPFNPAAAPIGSGANSLVLEAFRASQENLAALQKIQEQTAQLHRQFLEGQEAALRTMETLAERQTQLYGQILGIAHASPAPPILHENVSPPIPPAVQRVVAAVTSVKSPIPVQAIVHPPTTVDALTAGNDIQKILLEVVAEKTGYPVEMLNPEMDLESDLGIDSIKRVEILSSLQEKLPDAPAIQPEETGKLRTLVDIIKFLADSRVGASQPPQRNKTEQILLTIVSDKTGYPLEMLNSEMDLESDLGIDSIKRVEILSVLQEQLPDAATIEPEQAGKLRTVAQIASFLAAAASSAELPSDGYSNGASNGTSHSNVAEILLQIVSEKTGYPAGMLSLEMDLESDLGIDSIKRVEILSSLQEQVPEAPTIEPQETGKLRTLAQIIEFLSATSNGTQRHNGGMRDALSNASIMEVRSRAPEIVHANGGHESPNHASERLRSAMAPLTRSVLAVKGLEDNSSRNRISLAPGSEVWITNDDKELSSVLARLLEADGLKVHLIELRATDLEPNEKLTGVIILAPAAACNSATWQDSSEEFLKNSFALAKLAGPSLQKSAATGAAFFATVSRLDGAFGFHSISQNDPVYGGLAGLSKTAGHEWHGVNCKALDLDPACEPTKEIAQTIIDELLSGGPTEVGISASGRIVLAQVEAPLGCNQMGTDAPPRFERGDVIVLSGGARGVTAEVAVAFAQRCQPTLVLIGRTPAPEAEPSWLEGVSGEAAVKRALLAHANGHGSSPKAIEAEYQRWAANREVRETLSRIEAAGARAAYYSVDIREANAVASVLSVARDKYGPIKGVIHGVGFLADRLIQDKTPEQFAAVFDTKVAGLRALLDATAGDPLKAVVLFSSVSGRYGRKGQVDYAMANEVLNKVAQKLAQSKKDTRVVSVNWGPWDGGMVTPALKKVFSQEGVGLIPLQAGAQYLIEELAGGSDGAVEVIINAPNAHDANSGVAAPLGSNGHTLAEPTRSIAFERVVDLDTHPFLHSHVINGNAVLPTAMIIEWLAHGALHENPGLLFHGFNDLRIFKGVILENGIPRRVRIETAKAKKKNGLWSVTVELRGTDESRQEHSVLHARAEMLLVSKLPAADSARGAHHADAYARTPEAVYREILFHGEHFQGIEEIAGLSERGLAASVKTAPAPHRWISDPLRSAWLADPLALDSGFQLMVLWTFEKFGAVSLPCAIRSYRQFQRQFPVDRVLARVNASKNGSSVAYADMEFVSERNGLIAKIEGYECVIDPSLNAAFRRNSVSDAAVS